jgi:hypothetical protein
MNIADFVEQEKNEKDKQIDKLKLENGLLTTANEGMKVELEKKNILVTELQNQVSSLKNEQENLQSNLKVFFSKFSHNLFFQKSQLREFIDASEKDKTTIQTLTVLFNFNLPLIFFFKTQLEESKKKESETDEKNKEMEVRLSILENKNREENLKSETDETYMRPSDVPRTVGKYVEF